jgi:hypothetical protein
MIYTFTMLYNELDLLRLKIAEEREYVDKIVVVEAGRTFRNYPKEFCFPLDEYRNDPKIVYFKIEDEERLKGWNKDRFGEIMQRNYAQSKFDFEPDDCIIVTDIDEIIRCDEIPKICDALRKYSYIGLEMKLYQYYLNAYRGDWKLPFACSGETAKKFTFNNLRWHFSNSEEFADVPPNPPVLSIKGGHFSYLGNAEQIAKKIKEGAVEFKDEYWSDVNRIREKILKLQDLFDRNAESASKTLIVSIDDSYPETILRNMEYWKRYVI